VRKFIATITVMLCIAGCNFYKETSVEADNGEFGCWVHIHTNKLPTLKQTRTAFEKYRKKGFGTCKDVSGIRFYLEGSGQGSYLIVRRSGEVSFAGTAVPRHRWSEAESWSDSYCKEKGVTCANTVTSDGKIISDPIWGRDIPTFITP